MSKQIDIDFNVFIVPPAESFDDTMRLHYGWSSPVRDADGGLLPVATFVADMDGVSEHIEAMQLFSADTYDYFGHGEGKLPFPVSQEEVIAYVKDDENKGRFSVWGFEEEIIWLAFRYLSGEGDDYDAFHDIVSATWGY